jgi:hypothetical protein
VSLCSFPSTTTSTDGPIARAYRVVLNCDRS